MELHRPNRSVIRVRLQFIWSKRETNDRGNSSANRKVTQEDSSATNYLQSKKLCRFSRQRTVFANCFVSATTERVISWRNERSFRPEEQFLLLAGSPCRRVEGVLEEPRGESIGRAIGVAGIGRGWEERFPRRKITLSSSAAKISRVVGESRVA